MKNLKASYKKVFIAGGLRTAQGNLGGSLTGFQASKLGVAVIRKLVEKYFPAGSPVAVDGVIVGNVLQAGAGQNPSRQCALGAGLSVETPCVTINKVCGSSMKAVEIAYRNIISGYGNVFIAGGIESMSNSPFLSKAARWGAKLGHVQLTDEIIIDGLWCPFTDMHMGAIVEKTAEKHGISRDCQDLFSFESNMKAAGAVKSGRFRDEIVPVEIAGKNEVKIFDADERPREDTTLEKLAKLPPVFKKGGTVTAGNSSGINDGAAMLAVVSEDASREAGFEPLAEIISVSEAGVEPQDFAVAPVKAINKVLSCAAMTMDDIDLFEINEAFAAQCLSVFSELGISEDFIKNRVNVNGGAIALGHPLGASGARIIVTLVHELLKRKAVSKKAGFGVASLCIGSGEAMAVLLKV